MNSKRSDQLERLRTDYLLLKNDICLKKSLPSSAKFKQNEEYVNTPEMPKQHASTIAYSAMSSNSIETKCSAPNCCLLSASKVLWKSIEKLNETQMQTSEKIYYTNSSAATKNGTQPNNYYKFSDFESDDKDNQPKLVNVRLLLYQNRQHIQLPKRKLSSDFGQRDLCIFCNSWFNVSENLPGSCSEAPDKAEVFISRITCYPLAQGVVYHCCRANDEVLATTDRYGNGYNVFSYGPGKTTKVKKLKRWLLLMILTLFVPCLCCYLPILGIYRLCSRSRGRHKPSRHCFRSSDKVPCCCQKKMTI